MTDPFGIDAIGQIMMPVQDLRRATLFYREVLGIPFLFEVPGMSFFDLDGVRLMLGVREGEKRPPGSVVYYRVEDLSAAYETLLARGVRFDQEPSLIAEMEDHELWMAFFRDSEDNRAALMAEVGRP